MFFFLYLLYVGLITTHGVSASESVLVDGQIVWCEQSKPKPEYDLNTAVHCTDPGPVSLIKLPMTTELFEYTLCNVFMNYTQQLKFHHVDQFYYGGSNLHNNRASNAAYMVLKWALIHLDYNPGGLWLEFGVAAGFSSNITSILRLEKHPFPELPSTIYAFDWFQGLPEDWLGQQLPSKKARFTQHAVPPPTQPDVEFVVGLFNETLPAFLETHAAPGTLTGTEGAVNNDNTVANAHMISFVNFDMDLFSGALYVLETLLPRLRSGTILHFHEFVQLRKSRGRNNEGRIHYREHVGDCSGNDELRALHQWLKQHPNVQVQLLPVQSRTFESAVFIVTRV